MSFLPFVALALPLSLASGPGLDEEVASWPGWRGPLQTGAAPDADPPLEWGPETNVRWRAALPGRGKSTPIVWGDRLFVLAAHAVRPATAEELAARPPFEGRGEAPPDEVLAFLALALDRTNGELLWERTVTERLPLTGLHSTNDYVSSSPVTDGEGLWVNFGSYGVYALDAAAGEVRWSYDLGPQRMRNGWGEGSSPALAGDALIVVADQEDQSFVVALDKRSGEERWRRDRDEPSTWTTPLVVRTGDVTQVVVNGTSAVTSYDAATGEILWRCSGQTVNAIPTPVPIGSAVVAASGYRGDACMAIDLAGRGDLTGTEAVRWNHTTGTPYVPSPAFADGRLFFLSKNSGMLTSLDTATGEVLVDRQRLDLGNVYASPLLAAGRVYVVDREGVTVVLDQDGLEVLATNDLGEPVDATPVAIGDTLYVRSSGTLWALGE